MKYLLRCLVWVLVIVVLMMPSAVSADVAPPSHPPGSNPGPGVDVTQVRMMSETLLIDVLRNNDVKSLGQAKVTADFTMRNLGSDTESIEVHFPISSNNGFGELPELKNLNIKVDDKAVATKRIMEEDPLWGSDPVPWAQFNATFPPGQDVHVQVTYLLDGTGEYPFVAYYYLLHTGAGWKDTIGSADLIVRFPYEANTFNIIFGEQIGWSSTIVGGMVNGNDAKWHFDNLEPDQNNDFQLSIVNPAVWQNALNEQDNVQKNPNDGEAWGRLGKLYKEMFFFRRGFRHDEGGGQLYSMSVDAYEKAVALLPDDALWHAGFANLLSIHAYYASQEGEDVTDEMLRSMQEINLALDLSPDDPKVKEIAETIYYLFPDAIKQYESGYEFLWLTAMPESSTPTETPIEPTSTPPATTPPLSTVTAVPAREAEATPTATPSASNPLCGSAAFVPLVLIWLARRKLHV